MTENQIEIAQAIDALAFNAASKFADQFTNGFVDTALVAELEQLFYKRCSL